ncbi:MAG: hypothetical protein ACR2NR_13665 [Solirubrobacteraceae bacterium]
MTVEDSNRWIDYGLSEIVVRSCYFPWGTKSIPYEWSVSAPLSTPTAAESLI